MKIILYLIGSLLIIYSIYMINIKKDSKTQEDLSTINKEVDFNKILDKKLAIEKYETNSIEKNTKEDKDKGNKRNLGSLVRNVKTDVNKISNKNNDKVVFLYHEGYSIEEIAKITKKSLREIEVIIKISI